MKILITGVNGLVGRAIVKNLFNGNTLIGISRSMGKKTHLDIEYRGIDLSTDPDLWGLSHHYFDAIVHCAASIKQDPLDEDLMLSNCMALRNIASFSIRQNCKRFIFISSITVIGRPSQLPITEDHLVRPVTAYQSTKYFGELYLASTLRNCNLSILRIPSPIGPGLDSGKIIPTIIRRCVNNEPISLLGSGRRIQNYIDVRDVAEAVRRAINCDARGVYNIAASRSYSNIEVVELCKRCLKSNSEVFFTGVDLEEENQWQISISKAVRDLKFDPVTSIESSVSELAKKYII
jgi:UDP-glucose 4-epimerase